VQQEKIKTKKTIGPAKKFSVSGENKNCNA